MTAETVFAHVDDIAWTEVQRQRNADGSISVIREKWPIIRPGFLSAHVLYEQQMVVRRHGHRSNHVVYVMGGGGWIGGRWCTAGTHVHVPLGSTFGPIVAGPEGLTCWELSFGEFGGWGDEPELYEHEIAQRGVTPLPDPPLDLGDWFVDPRGDWGAERATPRVDGLDEVVTDLADLACHSICAVRLDADGSVAEARLRLPVAEPGFVSAHVELDPGMVLRRHRTTSQRVLYLLDGGAWFDGQWCTPGTHVEIPPGAALGPIVAGDTGARFLVLSDGDQRTTGLDRAEHLELLSTRGLSPLPLPDLQLPPGLVDTRDQWDA